MIALLGVLRHHVHGQRVDDDAVVDLDHQLVLVEEAGVFFIRQRGGKGHEVQSAPQQLVRVEGKKIIDGVCCGKVSGLLLIWSGTEGVVFPVVLDLIADDVAVLILDGLAYDVFAAHCAYSPF